MVNEHPHRAARAAYVKKLVDDDDRSARWLATKVGISNSAMSERLRGTLPFLADELELIAAALKIDAGEFYRGYRLAGTDEK